MHSIVSESQAFVCSFREACPKFILIQSCFPTPKFAWTAVQTVINDGIDPISCWQGVTRIIGEAVWQSVQKEN